MTPTAEVAAFKSYIHDVFDILESFNYPELVLEFDPEDVAKSVGKTMSKMYYLGVSRRFCAIIIWSITMNYHIISQTEGQVKH